MAPSQARRRNGPRQGGRKGDVYRIGGVDIAWDPELDLDKPRPTPLFPVYKVEKPHCLSEEQKHQVRHLKRIQSTIRHGPLYTVLSENTRAVKSGTTSSATFDSFNDMQKYSQRYVFKSRTVPKLDTRNYVLGFFPKELWPLLDSKYHNPPPVTRKRPSGKRQEFLNQDKESAPDHPEQDENENDENNPDEEDDLAEEEEIDDDYEDEDEGGDYNAEQYFDDGGDGGGEDADAAEDAGDYL